MPQLASIRALVGAVLLTTLSLGGCSCDPAASSIVGLAYVAPNPGSRIQLSDDLDPATAGVQVLVRLRAVGLNKADSGASVSLRNTSDVDASAVTGSVTINEQGIGLVSFENFTLVSGSNQLEATLSHGFGSDLLTKASFSVVAPGGPTCRFTAAPNGPVIASGVTLSEDLDLINAGFQTHIGVSCAGEGVVDGLTVGLNVAGAAGALDTTLSGGSAVFSNANLPEGAVRLTTYLLLNQDQAATANVEFTVDTGRCDVVVNSPLNGVAILVSDDVDDSTPSIADVDVVVSSSRCGEGSTVSIAIGGESFDGQIGADGSASLRIQLPQSDSVSDFQVFDVIVADVSGTRNQGGSLRQSHLVDTIAPTLEIVGIAVDGSSVLTASDDQDANPLDELTYRLQVRATNFADVAFVFASVDGDDASAVSSSLTDLGIATFDIRLAAGQRSIRVYTNDAAGNPGEDLRSLTVDITVPVVTLLQPAQSGAVLAASDADTDLPGFQVDCAVSVANFSTIAALEPLVFCELQTLSENGDPTGPWVRSAAASPEARDGDVGIGGIRLTLPDGFWGIRAGAITRNGTGNEAAPSAALNLQVDGTAPTITFASPTEGAVLNAGNAAIELIVSDAEEGQSVTLSANGGPAFDPAPTVDGNGRVLVEGLTWAAQDGPVTLTADVSDRAGNPASQASVSLRVDATPPGISLVGLDGSSAGAARDIVADGTLNATQNIRLDWGADLSNGLQYGFNVIVTNEALGQVVSLRINGSVINGATVDVGGNHVASFTNNDVGYTLLEGENSVSATVIDPAGNTRTVDALVSVTTGQPFVRILTPNDGAFVNTTTVNVTASSNAAEGAACRLVARLAGQPDINGSAVAAARGALDFGELELLIDGAWALTASCPFAGRDPVDSALSSINIDTRPPQLSFTGIPQVNGANVYTLADPADSTQGNRYRRHITVSAAANGACTLGGINPSALLTVTGGGVDLANIQRTSFSPGDACSFTFDAIALADEVNDASSSVTLAVSVNDTAGNTGTANAAVLVDRVGPTVVINQPQSNATLAADQDENQAIPQVQYDVTATVTGAEAGSSASLTLSNAAQGSQVIGGGGDVDFGGITFPDGVHSVSVSASDSVSNSASAESTNIRVDGSAPTLSIFSPRQDDVFGIAEDSNPQLAGYQINVTITIQGVDNGTEIQVFADGNLASTGTVQGNTAVVGNVTIAEGTREVRVNASDGINTATATISIIVDLTPPTTTPCTFAEDDGPNAGIYTFNVSEDGNGQIAGWQGSCATTVTGGFEGSNVHVVSNNPAPNTTVGTGTLNGGAATFSISLPDGAHTLFIQATDEAGNISAPGNGQVAQVDTVAPSVSITSPGDGSVLLANEDADNQAAGLQYSVAASTDAEAGTTVSLRANGNEIATGSVANGAVTAIATLPEGAVAIIALATDEAGNASTSAAVNVTIDSLAPIIAITSPAAGASFGDNDDLDEDVNGFQVDVSLSASQVENAQRVSVRSSVGGERCSANTTGNPQTIRCSLLQGMGQTLSAVVSDINGNETTSALVQIDINLQAPTLFFTSPATNPVALNAGDDSNNGLDGLQYTFVLTSDANGQTVSLSDGGNAIGSGVVANNSVSIGPVTLTEAIHAISASVTDNNNTALVDVSVTVDVTAPTIALSSPAASPTTFTAADDQQGGAPLNTSFGLSVTGAIGGSLSGSSDQTATINSTNVNGDGVVTLTNATLNSGLTHNLTFTVVDTAGNTASVALQALVDVVAPDAMDISAAVQNTRTRTVRLNWNEPGDDADQGTVTGYQVRYSENAINDANFAGATQVAEAINPVAAGNALQVDVAGLPFDNDNVRIAARALDEVGNVSELTASALVSVDLSWDSSTATATGSSSYFGYATCSGDFNNDGRMDIAIGDLFYNANVGAMWILYGSNLQNPTLSRIDGTVAGGKFGQACAVGDFNGDGFADLAVGAPGASTNNGVVTIHQGSGAGVVVNAAATIMGSGASGSFGSALSAGGSVVGDVSIDLAIGSQLADNRAGTVTIFDGDDLSGTVSLASAFVLTGEASNRVGKNVIIGKDVTGDGQADVVSGAWRRGGNDGGVYVIAGPVVAVAMTSADANVSVLDGETNRRVGAWLTVGDVDGDGGNDIIAATSRNGYNLMVYHGGAGLDGIIDTVVSQPAGANESFFALLSEDSVCDIDNDGDDELLVGGENWSWVLDHEALTSTPLRTYNEGTGFIHPVCAGDLNGTGSVDLALVVRNTDGSVILKY